jgi:G6PDH family F420-dependent oxidoreductase
MRFGVVNAPGQRYHPAIVAQAAATLEAMYPGRFWVALGSGEASNEHITGGGWPRKAIRNQRLRECAEIMRALFAGEEVSHDGLVTVDRARLWTRPETPPPLLAAAVSVETARWAAEWADGLATVAQDVGHLWRMIAEYRSAGGRGPLLLQVHLSYAADERTALALAHDQWRSNILGPPASWDIDSTAVFDEVSASVPVEAMYGSVRISAEPKQHADWLHEYAELGFDEIYLHHVGKDQREFVEVFGAQVLPELAR